jgi:single-stranded-DNA-specific exonuclease
LPESHPLINLPGVGVTYKLIEALANHQSFITNNLLDLVALGIVADVAYQQADTRYLLQRGLQQLRSGPRPGIRALLRTAGVDVSSVNAETIGFQLGPRLNAAGRLDTAELSVQLLTAPDEASANAIARQIETLNNERRQLQRSVEQDALRMIERDPSLAKHPVIVLHSPDWHASVVGVVANTVSERYNRPAILISVRPGEVGRGSARSLPGIDIHAAIAAQAHLIETSGGHPMAAGFGIRSENVPAFQESVNRHVKGQLLLTSDSSDPDQQSITNNQSTNNFPIAWRDVTLSLAEQIELLAPFGSGNPRPLLRSDALKFLRAEPLGKDGKHQAIYLQDETGHIARAAWWRSGGQIMPESGASVSLVFSLQNNVFQGKARAQLEVVSLEFARNETATTQASVSAHFNILDKRGELNRTATLTQLEQEFGPGNVQLWCEPPLVLNHSTNNQKPITRLQLVPKPVLVLWSAPASMAVLRQVVLAAQPQTVVLVGAISSESDAPEAFMRQLLGMVKVSQQRGKSLDDAEVMARMAARIGHREESVMEGIACYRRGEMSSASLNLQLQETRAYRKYFCEASAEAVLRIAYNPTD